MGASLTTDRPMIPTDTHGVKPLPTIPTLPVWATVEPALVPAAGGARILGVSLRTFHKLRPQLPAPVELGPRCLRWRVAELRQWIAERAAIATARPEPERLAKARRGRPVAPASPEFIRSQLELAGASTAGTT